MIRYVARTDSALYLTPRRAVKPGSYEARATLHRDVAEARVFPTQGAAANAMKQAWGGDFFIFEAQVVLNEASAKLYTGKDRDRIEQERRGLASFLGVRRK